MGFAWETGEGGATVTLRFSGGPRSGPFALTGCWLAHFTPSSPCNGSAGSWCNPKSDRTSHYVRRAARRSPTADTAGRYRCFSADSFARGVSRPHGRVPPYRFFPNAGLCAGPPCHRSRGPRTRSRSRNARRSRRSARGTSDTRGSRVPPGIARRPPRVGQSAC